MKSVSEGFNKYNTLDINILRIELLSGEVIDLKNSFEEVDIFRDIFSLGMTASLIIDDVLNITNNGPILGGERVFISFKSPFYKDYTELMFRVSMVSERVATSQAMCMVKLELCSEALYFGLSKSVSIGYQSQYSNVVKTLWNEIKIDSEIKTDSTAGLFTGCTTHSRNIIETIKEFANRSMCSDNMGFIYFEDFDGGVYASWKKILTQTAAQKLIFQPQGTEEDIKKDWMNTYSIQFESNSRDALEYMRRGAANRTNKNYDTNRKLIEDHVMNVSDISDNFKLNTGVIKVKDSEKSSRIYNKFTLKDNSNKSITDKINTEALLNYNSTTICNVGDNQARLGQLVELNLPAPQLPDGVSQKMEKFFSGKYLVTGIKDNIRKDGYRTYRNLVTESLLNEV